MRRSRRGRRSTTRSHLGLDPKHFPGADFAEKGVSFRDNVVRPLFFNPLQQGVSPFYLYVNVTTAETLRKVLADPHKYAPSGVYIMRIHGTFVNFLDLSPAIQNDIITRLDAQSSALACWDQGGLTLSGEWCNIHIVNMSVGLSI